MTAQIDSKFHHLIRIEMKDNRPELIGWIYVGVGARVQDVLCDDREFMPIQVEQDGSDTALFFIRKTEIALIQVWQGE